MDDNNVVANDEGNHQISQAFGQMEEKELNSPLKSGLIAIDDSLQQSRHNAEVFELNSRSQYMAQEPQVMSAKHSTRNQQQSLFRVSPTKSSRNNADHYQGAQFWNQENLPQINIIKTISQQTQFNKEKEDVNQESQILEKRQQMEDVQEEEQHFDNQLLDFDNIQEMKVVAQAVSQNEQLIERKQNKNFVEEQQNIIKHDNLKKQPLKFGQRGSPKNNQNAEINNDFDRSIIPMFDQSKINSANHSMIGFDSNTSRFIQQDTTAILRRDQTLIFEDNDKDISAIQKTNDHTQINLNNEFEHHQTFSNQLDQSQINNFGSLHKHANSQMGVSQDLTKIHSEMPSQDNTSNAFASTTHLGLTSASERQLTNKYKMRQKVLNLQINVEEIEKQEQRRQAQKDALAQAVIQKNQQKSQQQQQQQNQINNNNQNRNNSNNNNANHIASINNNNTNNNINSSSRAVIEEVIGLNRGQQNQSQSRAMQLGNQAQVSENRINNNNNNIRSNNNINNNEENNVNQFEDQLSNRVYQKTLLLQLKLVVISVFSFVIFFDSGVRNNIFLFLALLLFLVFFYKLMLLVRKYRRDFIVTVVEKYQVTELASFIIFLLLIYAMVKYANQPVTIIILYLPFIHILWWRAVMRQSFMNSFLLNVKLFFRVFVFFQAFLVCLKYDQFIAWEWSIVFIPSWLLLIGFGFYFIQIFVLTVWYSVNYLRGKAKLTEVFGFFWGLISFCCYSLCFFFSISGLVTFFNNSSNQYESIQESMLFCIAFNFGLFLFDIVFKKQIRMYIHEQNKEKLREEQLAQNFQMHRRDEEQNNIDQQNGQPESSQFNIDEMIQNNQERIRQKYSSNHYKSRNFNLPLFMVQSSNTYFKTVDQRKQDVEMQQNENLDTIRAGNTLRQLRNNRDIQSVTDRIKDNNQSLASRNMLFAQQSQNNESNMANFPVGGLENLINSPKKDLLYQQKTFNQTRAAQFPSTGIMQKRGSHNQIFSPSVKSSQSEKEQQTCLICFVELPDSVMMPCGHGGICSHCARDVCKKNGICYLCRQKGKLKKVVGITEIKRKKVQSNKNPMNSNHQFD